VKSKASLTGISVLLVFFLGRAAWNRIERQKIREGNLWKVIVAVDGLETEFTGLLDTGNSLADPITGLPVAVVEWQALENLLPAALLQAYCQNEDVTMNLGEKRIEGDWETRLRIVPYRGIGGTVGMLLAFRPANFMIRQGNFQSQTDKILVAINPKPMVGDKSYQAILPPSCAPNSNSSIAS
jgi:stage II sporulation protein GA (sporulation sigma-E factor processing peptidase)